MNVIVFGGNGFIGSHLIDRLLTMGFNISVYDRYFEKYRKPLKKINYILGDFNDNELIDKSLKNIDLVFHLISTTGPATSNENIFYDLKSNLMATIKLLDNCVKNKIKKIIYISSGGSVYGSTKKIPIDEYVIKRPESSYGIVKLAIESYLDLYERLYKLDYSIIRPSNPYGPRQNPFGSQGVISIFLGNFKTNKPIEIWGDGEIVRDFIYIDDLIEGIVKAIDYHGEEKIFNIGCGEGKSLNDIIKIIKKVTKKNINIQYLPGRLFDPKEVVLDIGRAEKVLNWFPKNGLEYGIEKTWYFINDLIVEE